MMRKLSSLIPSYLDIFLLQALVEFGFGVLSLIQPAFLFGRPSSPAAGAAATIASAAMIAIGVASFWAGGARDGEPGKQAVALGSVAYHGLVAALTPKEQMGALGTHAISYLGGSGFDTTRLGGIPALAGTAFHLTMVLLFGRYLFQTWGRRTGGR